MEQHQQQLGSDISNATTVVNNQLTRLKMLDVKFSTMEKDFRHQIAMNIKTGNNSRAKALANELSNIRRIQRTTQNMSIALEVVVIRFSTIKEFAMIMETINPTIEMINDIQRDISRVVPTANSVFSEMSSITSEVLVNSTIKLSPERISSPLDTDAISILKEVQGILEEETKVKLPEVPTITAERKMIFEKEDKARNRDTILVEG